MDIGQQMPRDAVRVTLSIGTTNRMWSLQDLATGSEKSDIRVQTVSQNSQIAVIDGPAHANDQRVYSLLVRSAQNHRGCIDHGLIHTGSDTKGGDANHSASTCAMAAGCSMGAMCPADSITDKTGWDNNLAMA